MRAALIKEIYGRGEYRLLRSLLKDGDMDLLSRPLAPSPGGVVGVLAIGEYVKSLSGDLVSRVSLEKIPLFGSHWKYRLPATEPSFFPEKFQVSNSASNSHRNTPNTLGTFFRFHRRRDLFRSFSQVVAINETNYGEISLRVTLELEKEMRMSLRDSRKKVQFRN